MEWLMLGLWIFSLICMMICAKQKDIIFVVVFAALMTQGLVELNGMQVKAIICEAHPTIESCMEDE